MAEPHTEIPEPEIHVKNCVCTETTIDSRCLQRQDVVDTLGADMLRPLQDRARAEQEAKEMLEPELCAHCKRSPVAYPGAVYCGAACCARAEDGQPPLEPEPCECDDTGLVPGAPGDGPEPCPACAEGDPTERCVCEDAEPEIAPAKPPCEGCTGDHEKPCACEPGTCAWPQELPSGPTTDLRLQAGRCDPTDRPRPHGEARRERAELLTSVRASRAHILQEHGVDIHYSPVSGYTVTVAGADAVLELVRHLESAQATLEFLAENDGTFEHLGELADGTRELLRQMKARRENR